MHPTRFTVEHPGREVAGTYVGPTTAPWGDPEEDKITIHPFAASGSSRHGLNVTEVHEMGHRAHMLLQHGGKQDWRIASGSSGPDPLREGIGDGYADRYAGPGTRNRALMEQYQRESGRQYKSYETTGYSANYEGWTLDQKALYTAVRAHVAATGEFPEYKAWPGMKEGKVDITEAHMGRPQGENFNISVADASMDATLHHLLSHSQAAKQALRQVTVKHSDYQGVEHEVPLKEVGHQAFRRHRDRQLLVNGQVQSIDAFGLSVSKNQFGEPLRTQDEVFESIGFDPANYGRKDFPRTRGPLVQPRAAV